MTTDQRDNFKKVLEEITKHLENVSNNEGSDNDDTESSDSEVENINKLNKNDDSSSEDDDQESHNESKKYEYDNDEDEGDDEGDDPDDYTDETMNMTEKRYESLLKMNVLNTPELETLFLKISHNGFYYRDGCEKHKDLVCFSCGNTLNLKNYSFQELNTKSFNNNHSDDCVHNKNMRFQDLYNRTISNQNYNYNSYCGKYSGY